MKKQKLKDYSGIPLHEVPFHFSVRDFCIMTKTSASITHAFAQGKIVEVCKVRLDDQHMPVSLEVLGDDKTRVFVSSAMLRPLDFKFQWGIYELRREETESSGKTRRVVWRVLGPGGWPSTTVVIERSLRTGRWDPHPVFSTGGASGMTLEHVEQHIGALQIIKELGRIEYPRITAKGT